jgi:hypothetical protein
MGLLNFGMLMRIGLLVAGFWWCKEILGRWRDDVAEFKTPDSTRRGIILVLWAATAVVLYLMGTFLWTVVATAVQAWKHPV